MPVVHDMAELFYFDGPGRAEAIRLLLRHAKIPFIDRRITPKDWPTYKDTFELKQVPVLNLYGRRLSQSYAILQYLGAEYGYMPISPEETYEVLCAMNTFEDLFTKFGRAYSPMSKFPEEEKKKFKAEFAAKDLPLFLGFLEDRLRAKDDKFYIVGSSLTVADFYVLGFYESMRAVPEVISAMDKASCPLLMNYLRTNSKGLEPKEPQKPKLHYFDMPGRGEAIRLLLRHAKVNFDDIRIKMTEWAEKKDSYPLKQLPMLEFMGKRLFQTDAIMHRLALKLGYLPLGGKKYSRVLELCGTIKDLFNDLVNILFGRFPAEKQKALMADYFEKKAPIIMGWLEKRLKGSKTGEFFVGRGYTLADFYMLCAARWVILAPGTKEQFEPILKTTPTLRQYLEKRLHDFP